jgi:8-oxo-dGTP pyrophosphatase MutT (NUDIX family)
MTERSRERPGGNGRSARRTRIETSSGGVVYRPDENGPRVLLIRDPYNNWGLPKGHIEGGETPEQAALREVEEETGLAGLSAVAELPTIDWYFRDRGKLVHKFCHFFLIVSHSGDACPQLDEGITECTWLPFTQALEQVSYANARDVIRIAAERLGVSLQA